jgi:hypothetical protein
MKQYKCNKTQTFAVFMFKEIKPTSIAGMIRRTQWRLGQGAQQEAALATLRWISYWRPLKGTLHGAPPATLCLAAPCSVPCCDMPCSAVHRAMLWYAVQRRAPCQAVICRPAPCSSVQRRAPCHVVLCRAAPCTVSCRDMPHCAVCHAMPCCADQTWTGELMLNASFEKLLHELFNWNIGLPWNIVLCRKKCIFLYDSWWIEDWKFASISIVNFIMK